MKRGIILITLAAAAAWFGLRAVSSRRPLLSPADFTAGGPGALEFCDPRNPRFLSVVDRASAVILTGLPGGRLQLATASGQPIGPKDLQNGSLRIFEVNDDLTVYQSGPAAATSIDGVWTFEQVETGRLFADFTPLATGQEMYASAKVKLSAPASGPHFSSSDVSLSTLPAQIFARQPVEVLIHGFDPIGPAELAAFDLRPTGPTGFFVSSPERVGERVVRFRLSFPDAGQYVLWVQIGVGAGAKFARFVETVLP